MSRDDRPGRHREGIDRTGDDDRPGSAHHGATRRPPGPVAPWYVRVRPHLERTVGTFGAAGVGTGLLGAAGGLVLTGGGAGEYGEYVVAWTFGLLGTVALAFAGVAVAAVTGVHAGETVRGRAAYLAGGVGGFAGQVVMVGVATLLLAPATRVHVGGAVAAMAVGSGLPAAVAGALGALVGRRTGFRRVRRDGGGRP